jgi:hypothetical protein
VFVLHKRRIVYIFVILFLISTVFIFLSHSKSFAENNGRYNQEAEVLSELGMFKGTNLGFELERKPTRIEGAVMLVRLLGREDTALEGNYIHPFTDVPEWASPYIGYMFETDLTKGKTAEVFGSNDIMSSHQYITFVLRALGYDDSTGDFSWDTSVTKAVEIGLVTQVESTLLIHNPLLRDDVAHISYKALSLNLNGSDETLWYKLVREEAVSSEIANRYYDKFNPPFSSQLYVLIDEQNIDQDWGKDKQTILESEKNRLVTQEDDSISFANKTQFGTIYKIYEFNSLNLLKSIIFSVFTVSYTDINHDLEYKKIKEHFTEKYGQPYHDETSKLIQSDQLNYSSSWVLPNYDIYLAVNKNKGMILISFFANENNVRVEDDIEDKPFHYISPNKDSRDVNWGASLQEVIDNEHAILLSQDEDSLMYLVKTSQTDYLLDYLFENDKLINSTYLITEDQLKNVQFVDYFNTLKDQLTDQYGNPETELVEWMNTESLYSKNEWELAVENNHLMLMNIWNTPSLKINLLLTGLTQRKSITIQFESNKG